MKPRSKLVIELWSVASTTQMIRNGELALPDFQRRFEWTVSDVRAYLSTILAGLPSGNLMIADNRALEVHLRPLEGAPALQSDHLNARVLLDGQQRLTSLWQATTDTGPDRYFVDFAALAKGADLLQDDVVISSPVYHLRQTQRRAMQEGRVLVPVSALVTSSHFFSWLHSSKRDATEVQNSSLSMEEMGEIFASQLVPLADYEIPVTRLSGDLDLSTVAQIFERTNKWGQRLDAFDLLVARLQGGGWSLRNAWADGLVAYPEISRVFGDNGLSTISAISLLLQGDVRRSAVLSLAPQRVATNWDSAIQATGEVAQYLLREGFRRPELLAYDVIATAMIAATMRGVPVESLGAYLWSASANRRYEVASNTTVVTDFRILMEGSVNALSSLDDVSANVVERNTRRSSRALWATLVALMLSEGPLDLASGMPLSSPDPEAPDEWSLVPLAKGGRSIETEQDVPARLRTAGQLLAFRGRSGELHRLGLTSLVERRLMQPELFGSSIDERLASQLLPPSELILSGVTPREIIAQRSMAMLSKLERKIFVRS